MACFLVCFPSLLPAQKSPDSTLASKPIPKKEFIEQGKNKFHPAKTWTIAGPGINLNKFSSLDGNLGISFHFQIKDFFYTAGLMRARQWTDGSFFPIDYNREFVELHLGTGLKEESTRTLYGFFLGPSFSHEVYIMPENGKLATFNSVGLYVDLHAVYKPVYDIGMGIDLFADVNFHYSVFGSRLIFFLSDAYKKEKR